MQDKIINLLKNNETESLCGEYFLIKRKDYEKLANEIQLIFALTDVSQQRELLNALADKFNDSTHTYVGQPMIEETLKAFNCG
tara:strand:- start:43 stop:291 length:249 start_codon:yes stop_codon:yes gene_type:complete